LFKFEAGAIHVREYSTMIRKELPSSQRHPQATGSDEEEKQASLMHDSGRWKAEVGGEEEEKKKFFKQHETDA
jgi:hypothetical protein